MNKARALRVGALAATLLANGLAVSAQDKVKERKVVSEDAVREVVVQENVIVTPHEGVRHPVIGAEAGGRFGGDDFVFVSTEMSFDGKIVKGSPYSAQAVTETTHTLADGNRIVRRNTANVYRDSEGRTRRDQTVGAIGPFATQGEPPMTFFINDPVAGVNYILDPRSKVARKMPSVKMFERSAIPPRDKIASNGAAAAADAARAEHRAKMGGDAAPRRRMRSSGYVFGTGGATAVGAPDVLMYSHDGDEPKVEQLGKQSVEGVEAEGQRMTMTIPAGAIGNERPIEIVSERWFSEDLQTVVMTRHSDPRFGETVYRLTNINRSEPARSLFEIPADYTLREPRGGTNFRFFNKKMPEGTAPPEN
ncbi:MAG TPA: hypothetical protein VFX96_10800 [Pyrinomonadaceae bacterium]|nr:hypothetical protein [Pyrinomonadaceae bacterium]